MTDVAAPVRRQGSWRAWPARHPRATCLVALLAIVLSVIAVGRLRPDASLGRMFPKHDPAAQSLTRVLDDFSAVEELLVLVTVPEAQRTNPPDTARLLAFAGRLDQAVKASPEASELTAGVLYRADEQTRSFFEKVLVPNGLFYLDDASYAAARQRLTPEEMRKQIGQNEALISAPGPAAEALAKAFLQDPLRLHEFVLDRLAASRPFHTYGNSDAFLSPDGYSLLVRVRGRRPPGDVEFSKQITEAIEKLAAKENIDGLQVELTGAYAIAATSARSIRRDMISSVISSVILLQVLFILAYWRPVRLFALAFGPVVVGVLWGFGAFATFSTSVTPLTAVVGAILAGMGIDYAVQYLSHYLTVRGTGAGPLESAERTSRTLFGPLFAAFFTSVIGFIAITGSSVPGLRDFATVGSLGLAGAFVGAVVLLPAVMVLLERWTRGTAISGRLFRTPIDPLLLWIARRGKVAATACIALLLVSAIVCCWPGPLLSLEPDLTVMHPSPNPALAAQAHVAERMGAAADSLLVHLQASSPNELLTLAHQVEERLHSPEARQAGVSGTYGLASLLPDPRVAARRISGTGPALAERTVADFRAAVADSIFDPAAFEPYARFLSRLLNPPAAPTIADLMPYRRLAETMLPAAAVESGRAPTEAITLVFVSNPLTTRAERERTIRTIRGNLAALPGATLTGMTVVAEDAESAVQRDLPRLLWISVLLVAVYLLLHFRSLTAAVLAVLPTIFSLVCLLAAMRLAGEKLNMVNLVSLPLLIGIDVDYGIFLVSMARQRRAGEEGLQEFVTRVAPSCHGIVICAASTIFGFGSLVLTSVPAIRSLGFAVGVGVTACVVATFLLLVPVLSGRTRTAEESRC